MLDFVCHYLLSSFSPNSQLPSLNKQYTSATSSIVKDVDDDSAPHSTSPCAPPPPYLPPEILLCIADSVPLTDTETLQSLRLVGNHQLASVATRKLFHTVSLNGDLKRIQSRIRFLLRIELLQHVRRVSVYESAFYSLPPRQRRANIRSFLQWGTQQQRQHQQQPGDGSSKQNDSNSFAGIFLDEQARSTWMTPQVEFIADAFCVLEVLQNSGVDVEIFFDGGDYSWRRREGFRGLVEYHLGEGSKHRVLPAVSQRAMAEWWGFRERALRAKGF